MDRSAPDDQFITAGGRPSEGETPVPELSVPGTRNTLRQHPNENGVRVVNADGTEKSVGEETQQVQGTYEELRDRAGQIGAEVGYKAQDYADTDSPQGVEEKKMGMREKMRQMGVCPIFVLYPRIYLPLGYRIMFGYVGFALGYFSSHILTGIRIAFLNNAGTRHMKC